MQAQAQFTIHSLNDVVTSATAPTNPYKGQLWMKSSVTPPVLFTYNGSSWVEANGTSTLRSNVTTLTTKQATLESNLNGLTSTVSSVTTRVTTLEDDYGTISEDVETLASSVSTLSQTATSIAARVTTAEGNITDLSASIDGIESRVTNAEGDISLLSQSITGITSRVGSAEGNITTLQQTATSISASVATKLDQDGGTPESISWQLGIGGFYIYHCSEEVFHVKDDGGLWVSGSIEAQSGTLGDMTILGTLYFGEDENYYISADLNRESYYVYLPGLSIGTSTATFSGNLSAPSGSIGGFTIGTSKIYKTKTSYSGSTAGVYLGTDGIGLGAGNFYVTSAGYLYSSYGSIGGFTINSVSIYNNKTSYSSTTSGVYLGTDGIGLGTGGFYVTSAGYLYSKYGSIGGFTITASAIYKTKTTYDSLTAGVYLGTDGIGLGTGSFYVTSAGYLYATNANISGAIYASGGEIADLTITGRLYFGNDETYYIDANYDDGAYYIYLPGFRVDDASGAVFTGTLSAPSGSIGGFTIGTNKIYKTKTSYSSTTSGVYLGTDGIGLGAGTFYVTSAGALYATNATITGTITNAASDGWGVKIISNRVEFLQNSSTVGQLYGSSGLYRANMTTTMSGVICSGLLRVTGDLVCGKCFGVSTGNGIYVSGKLALTMGQIKVQTNTGKTRYLLFYCGILVGISASSYSGITDYSAGSYDG